MIEGRLLHQEMSQVSGVCHVSGKAVAHAALKAGHITRAKYQSARSKLVNADAGKHSVALLPTPARKRSGFPLSDLKETYGFKRDLPMREADPLRATTD